MYQYASTLHCIVAESIYLPNLNTDKSEFVKRSPTKFSHYSNLLAFIYVANLVNGRWMDFRAFEMVFLMGTNFRLT